MPYVKLTTETGYKWETNVSSTATKESIEKYFLGNVFNVGSYPTEKMETVIKVEYFENN